MKKHIDIISELVEFANQNWIGFKSMLKERGFEEDPEEALQSLEEELHQ